MQFIDGIDICFQASPVDPLVIIYGEVNGNYGILMLLFDPDEGMTKVGRMCLTHQIVSSVVFSPTGREIVAGAMSAGHIFIYKVSNNTEDIIDLWMCGRLTFLMLCFRSFQKTTS